MTLEGAINFNDTNEYTIYTMNSASAGQYCVVLPKNNSGVYNMLVDLHMKSLFDEVNSGGRTKDDLIKEISSEYVKVKGKYSDAILVIPMFDEVNYINIISNNDKQKMIDEVKKIGAITSELYKKLIDSGVEKQKIDQKIIIIEKNDYDKKFVEWLTEQMPNFVSGVAISEFDSSNDNPFVANDSNNVNIDNIFGPSPVVENSNVQPVANPEVAPAQPTNDLFGNVAETPVETVIPPVSPQPVEQSVVENQVVEQSVQQSTTENLVAPQPVPQQVEQPIAEMPVAEGPKPVENVELEKTVTFSPVTDANASATPVQEVVQPQNGETAVGNNGAVSDGSVTKKSNGFVNLAILLVILVGVTLISIELGKFLYNTYGV